MHCRSFFDRCCAHCCCARFLVLSVTVLGRVGGAPCQRRGRPRASAGACAGGPEAPGSRQAVLLVPLRMGMAPGGDPVRQKSRIPLSQDRKIDLKMRVTVSRMQSAA